MLITLWITQRENAYVEIEKLPEERIKSYSCNMREVRSVRFYQAVEAMAKSGARLMLESLLWLSNSGGMERRLPRTEESPAIVSAGRERRRDLRISLLIGLIVWSSMQNGCTKGCRNLPGRLVAMVPQ
jgi:hypothetical protein